MAGKLACRIRVRTLGASRDVTSASMIVRRNSSGFHRWVFAVTSTSGASLHIAAIFNHVSPSFRSAGSGGGHDTSPPSMTNACPAAVGRDARPPVARIGRTSAARHRPNTTARSSTETLPGGVLPLSFGRQPPTRPTGVGDDVEQRYVHNRVMLAPSECQSGSFRVTPVGTPDLYLGKAADLGVLAAGSKGRRVRLQGLPHVVDDWVVPYASTSSSGDRQT